MGSSRRRVAFITSHFPFDGKEPFLHPELQEIAKAVDLVIVPVASNMRNCWFSDMRGSVSNVHAPFALQTLASAFWEFLKQPVKALHLFVRVVAAPGNPRARLRNAAIFPKALAVTKVLRENNVSHIHAYWLSTPATVAFVASELTGLTWSASGHRWDLFDNNVRSAPGAPRAGFVRSAEFIRTVSAEGCSRVRYAFGPDAQAKVHLVHLGVRLPDDNRANGGSDSAPLRMACVATLTPVKAHGVLLHALAKLKSSGTAFDCAIIGDGPLREEIRETITQLNLHDCVRMVPQIPHAELLKKMQTGAFDAVVLTSRHEGIPVSLIEAMAAALPVVATKAGGVTDLVDESCGILANVDDVDGVEAGIRALATDPELRERLGRNARTKVQREFAVENTAAQMIELIEECMTPEPATISPRPPVNAPRSYAD